MTPAACGASVHTKWFFLVSIVGPARSPRLIGRSRVEIVGDDQPSQPYHAAAQAGLGAADAAVLVRRWEEAAIHLAAAGLESAVRDAAAAGHDMCALALAGEVRPLPDIATILRAHTLMHKAEGQLSLGAVAAAGELVGLRVVHAGDTTAGDVVAQLGRTAGAPWTADQKRAAAAAIVALR